MLVTSIPIARGSIEQLHFYCNHAQNSMKIVTLVETARIDDVDQFIFRHRGKA